MGTHAIGTFTGKDGTELFFQHWMPEADPSSLVIISHGYAEHGRRYSHVGEKFSDAGMAVFVSDHKGHGRSGGRRTDIEDFNDYVEDLDIFVRKIREEYPDKKLFLLGHSMGGVIAALYAARHGDLITGLVLTGPGLIISVKVPPLLKKLSGVLAALFPLAKVSPPIAEYISRDEEVVRTYIEDPLVYSDKTKARMGTALLKLEDWVPEELDRITVPTLLMHGGADKVADPESSRLIYERIGSSDKTLKYWDGLYHEIMNEPEKDEVLSEIMVWMEGRL